MFTNDDVVKLATAGISEDAIIAKILASGATLGTTSHSSHCSTTATTPGHSRSGLRGVNSLV